MSETQSGETRRAEALAEAWQAALKAMWAFLVVLMTLMLRAVQALFVLARPALLVGCVVAAGYTSVALFGTVLVRYGGDLPAMILALAFTVITPATLIALSAERYGVWATALATAALEFLAHLGIERSPPLVLALVPILALTATTLNFLVQPLGLPRGQKPQEETNEQQERNTSTIMDRDGKPDHLHGDQELRSHQQDTAG